MFNSLIDLVYRKFLHPALSFLGWALLLSLLTFAAVTLYYLIRYRLNPFHLNRDRLVSIPIRLPLASFIRWKVVDLLDAPQKRREFRESGLTLYCGMQGSGKTISMVDYLNRLRFCYPECVIVTNFGYTHADRYMQSWQDFLDIRNGTRGVIFAIDEIHSEYSAASWRDFPEDLLSEISQQRKQRVKIVASSQIFCRVAKPIREQAVSVVLCSTLMGRWTFCREYNAREYEQYADSVTKKIKAISKRSFIQSDALRSCYDTYAKIERMQKLSFIPRGERGER